MKITRKNIELCVLFGLIASIILGFSRFNAACDDLRDNVIRLHVIANSDNATDQNVKYLVRDAILKQSNEFFSQSTTLEDAENVILNSLESIKATADEVIQSNGLNYYSDAKIGTCYFENREYEDFTLPAGEYRSLIVKLGEGKGQNWWCVIFPAVCLPAASDADLSDSTCKVGAMIATEPQNYIIRFKTVEWYEDIKHFLKNKAK